jgi:hypothetical protein
VSPVKYELGFISQKATFFIVTAVKTSNLTSIISIFRVENQSSFLSNYMMDVGLLLG